MNRIKNLLEGDRHTDELPKLISDHVAFSVGLLRSAGVDEQTIKLHEYTARKYWEHAVKHERERLVQNKLRGLEEV